MSDNTIIEQFESIKEDITDLKDNVKTVLTVFNDKNKIINKLINLCKKHVPEDKQLELEMDELKDEIKSSSDKISELNKTSKQFEKDLRSSIKKLSKKPKRDNTNSALTKVVDIPAKFKKFLKVDEDELPRNKIVSQFCKICKDKGYYQGKNIHLDKKACKILKVETDRVIEFSQLQPFVSEMLKSN